jgi:hypothetical protein
MRVKNKKKKKILFNKRYAGVGIVDPDPDSMGSLDPDPEGRKRLIEKKWIRIHIRILSKFWARISIRIYNTG